MNRQILKSNLGDGTKLWTVTLTGDPTDLGSPAARASQISLLKTLADTPDLQLCGATFFRTLKMQHTGDAWTIVMEAVSP